MYMQDDTGKQIVNTIGNLTVDTSNLLTDATGQDIVTAINNITMPTASNITYDNSQSTLIATNVQNAIDELNNDKLNKISNIITVNNSETLSSGVHLSISSVTLESGYYILQAGVSFPYNTTGIRRILLARTATSTVNPILSGVENMFNQLSVNACDIISNSYIQTLQLNVILYIDADTYPTVYLRAYQNSGTSMTVNGSIRYIKVV